MRIHETYVNKMLSLEPQNNPCEILEEEEWCTILNWRDQGSIENVEKIATCISASSTA